MLRIFCRLYHVSQVNYNLKRQGKKLCKMINPSTKRSWYPSKAAACMPTMKSLTKAQNEPGKQGVHRIAMLNKLFMKHITDIMSTGTIAMDVVGQGIEISKVKITPDFNTVNVYWVCKGNSSDEQTQSLLNKVGGALRHELSSLRVMGEVPYVVFVKDMNENRLVDLDNRLAIADYGEDYTPTEIGHLLKTEFTLDTKLSPEIKAKIKQLEDAFPIEEELVPEMTHTVFGLDHAKIMARLLAARKRSRDAWSNVAADDAVISYRAPADEAAKEIEGGSQKKELAEFLFKRQILENKRQKQLRRSSEDWQLAMYDKNDDADEQVYRYDEEDDDEYYEDDEFEESSRTKDDIQRS